MCMPPVLLSGRFPSATVLQGVSWWICVGRLVLLVPPAPLVQAEAALPGRRASLDHLVPGRLGPLKAAVRLWRRSPPGCLLPGRPGPRKALAASWWRAPPRCLLQGLLGPWKAAVRSWRRAPLRCGLRGLGVPLKVLVSPWWQPPLDCLAPGRLGALQAAAAPWRRATSDRLGSGVAAVSTRGPAPPLRLAGSMASVLSGAGLGSPPLSQRAGQC